MRLASPRGMAFHRGLKPLCLKSPWGLLFVANHGLPQGVETHVPDKSTWLSLIQVYSECIK